MLSHEVEERLKLIHNEIHYLRDQIDNLKTQLTSVIWKVVGLGTGSGALGFVVALLLNKLV